MKPFASGARVLHVKTKELLSPSLSEQKTFPTYVYVEDIPCLSVVTFIIFKVKFKGSNIHHSAVNYNTSKILYRRSNLSYLLEHQFIHDIVNEYKQSPLASEEEMFFNRNYLNKIKTT